MQGTDTVIVTGGASGLGRAVACAVHERGGHPLVLDRNPANGFDHEVVDLAETRRVEAMVERICHHLPGHLRGVVAAAGIDACGPLERTDPQAWERVVAVNLLGNAAVIRAAIPHLEAGGGRVVTVASTLGRRALPDATAYCASKFGMVGFTQSLAAELAGRVGVTLLIPGGMATGFFDERDARYRPGPDADLNDPRNVAEAVLFALEQPRGCEVRELVIATATEPSWP
ncbi:MAG: SDR family oxidoreductase [Candidatus Dormibacteraeota bacterium]|nr:SDR family oxidoreductase [Candidatus Dormibacteraeota bacterium]